MSAAQLSMLAATGPTARATDADTSKAALPSGQFLSELQGLVYAAHRHGRLYVTGLTDDDLVRLLPDHNPGSVIKRRTELVAAGLLKDTGKRRPVRRSGRMAIVWGLA